MSARSAVGSGCSTSDGRSSDAADQLEPLAGDPSPARHVLVNPEGVVAEITAEKLIARRCTATSSITFPIDPETGGPAAEPRWALGPDGRLIDRPRG